MNNSFSIQDIVKNSWELVKKNLKFFAILTLAAWTIQFIPSYINGLITNSVLGFVFSLISWVVNTLVTVGLITISLKFIKQKTANYKDAMEKFNQFVPYLVGSIYYSLIVLAGMILLIVPGIIWAIRYQFYGYLIIDQGLKPKEALTKSKEMTKGKLGKLFLFGLALVGVNLIGVILLGVGLLISVPVSLLASALLYQTLLGNGVKTTAAQTATATSPTVSAKDTTPTANVWKDYRQS